MIAPKPLIHPFHIQYHRPQQRPKKVGFMTMAAAFRTPDGGILLCSDQEWNDEGGSKREINKNYRMNFSSCTICITGAGPGSSVIKAWAEIHARLAEASKNGSDIWTDHKELIEKVLDEVHYAYRDRLVNWPLSLIVVVAPRGADISKVPVLYFTDGPVLIPSYHYCSVGAGKQMADYIADRLYEPHRLDYNQLLVLAAFVLREVEKSVPYVGMGANIMSIHKDGMTVGMLGPDFVKEIQDKIPNLFDIVWQQWDVKSYLPSWYSKSGDLP